MTTNEINHGKLLDDWVRHLRLKPKILLERLGYENHDNLYYWYGKKEIRMSVLQKWASAFGITLETLLAGPDEYKKNQSAATEGSVPYQLHHGQRLETLAEEKGTSITTLAEFLDVSRPTVYALFQKPVIDAEMLEKLAKYYNVPRTYFTGGGPTKGYFEQNQNEVVKQMEVMLNKKFSEYLAATEVMLKKYCAPGKAS